MTPSYRQLAKLCRDAPVRTGEPMRLLTDDETAQIAQALEEAATLRHTALKSAQRLRRSRQALNVLLPHTDLALALLTSIEEDCLLLEKAAGKPADIEQGGR